MRVPMAASVPPTTPLRAPASVIPTAGEVVAGPAIPAIDRVRLFSADQWEAFIEEWAFGSPDLQKRYEDVRRVGGAGDMGCDVVGLLADARWDNYQCKHYDRPLTPTDAWPELGKLLVHTYRGELSVPERYLFVAPQGVGAKLSRLLRDRNRLRTGLLTAWDRRCKTKVSQKPVPMDDELRAYIEGFDFSIFSSISPLRVIDEHRKTRWHVARFGSALPPRPTPVEPPPTPEQEEALYVAELLAAYSDHLKVDVDGPAALEAHKPLAEHFDDSRIAFYSAESLRVFSRDTLPPDSFEALQRELHAGVRDDIRHPHPDGYQRVLAVTKQAQAVPLGAHPLANTATGTDLRGVCHQLANDGKVRWTE